jgi:hypothetical protein
VAKYNKKAKRHAAESKHRTKKMLREAASRSGPVKVSYLPGFEPPPAQGTKFPFRATINGEPAIVWPDRIEYS